jgi:hypothetical protein
MVPEIHFWGSFPYKFKRPLSYKFKCHLSVWVIQIKTSKPSENVLHGRRCQLTHLAYLCGGEGGVANVPTFHGDRFFNVCRLPCLLGMGVWDITSTTSREQENWLYLIDIFRFYWIPMTGAFLIMTFLISLKRFFSRIFCKRQRVKNWNG